MRITTAGLRSGFPVTRFAAPQANMRQSHLGLRHRVAPRLTPHEGQRARVPLLDALHLAARGVSPTARIRAEGSASPALRAVVLRRSDSITWSRPADAHAHRPRSRSAAPWRG